MSPYLLLGAPTLPPRTLPASGSYISPICGSPALCASAVAAGAAAGPKPHLVAGAPQGTYLATFYSPRCAECDKTYTFGDDKNTCQSLNHPKRQVGNGASDRVNSKRLVITCSGAVSSVALCVRGGVRGLARLGPTASPRAV